jgi:hypothetical protein
MDWQLIRQGREQIFEILHNQDRKPSPNLFDKSVLELYEHLAKRYYC